MLDLDAQTRLQLARERHARLRSDAKRDHQALTVLETRIRRHGHRLARLRRIRRPVTAP